MMIATTQGWAVSFGGISLSFDSHAEAKRFIKDGRKRVADRRGMFKAVIVRTTVPHSSREVIQ